MQEMQGHLVIFSRNQIIFGFPPSGMPGQRPERLPLLGPPVHPRLPPPPRRQQLSQPAHLLPVQRPVQEGRKVMN